MAARNRKSFLNYEPVSFSLTDGTNIPPPEASPPSTANGIKPEDHQTEDESTTKLGTEAATDAANGHGGDPPQTANGSTQQTSPARSQGVRRLFSLSSLRSSFSSSRASLNLPQETTTRRPTSPNASVGTGTTTSINGDGSHGNKLVKNSHASRSQSRPTKKSGGWFKRKSGLWNAENGLASIGEHGPDSKRLRDRSPAPLLPEIQELAGGDLHGGEVEWDDKLFKKSAP